MCFPSRLSSRAKIIARDTLAHALLIKHSGRASGQLLLKMALPSSPPLLPETDIPTSPLLLPEEAAELPLRPNLSHVSYRGVSRKRQFSDYDCLSSDPIFSEPDSDVEEEVGGNRRKRKRLLKGPWFNLRRASTQSLIRRVALQDKFDSGIFMGSDLSDDTIDSTLPDPRTLARPSMEIDTTPRPTAVPSSSQKTPTVEQLASKCINHCLETGRESVDLSDFNLTILSNTTLKPLHQLIKHPHVDLSEPPSEDDFSPLTPSVQLFLSGNKLTSLPSELFRLINITVLSLRNNLLQEIPPSIGKLPHLKEFNIAQNSIRWLPWEMLDLMHCRGSHRQITVRPNPLIDPIPDMSGPSPLPRPAFTTSEFKEHLSRWGETNGAFFNQMKRWYNEDGAPWTMRHELELRLKLGRLRFNSYITEASRAGVELQQCNEQLIYLTSSAIRFLEIDGSMHRTTTAAIEGCVEDKFRAAVDPLTDAPAERNSSIPSLYEFALRSLQANTALDSLLQFEEDFSPAIATSLRAASRGVEYGNESCSACGNHFLIARAECVEYWCNGFPSQDHLTQETVLPFLGRACSWKCAMPSELGAFRF